MGVVDRAGFESDTAPRRIAGSGTSEREWQTWVGLAALPTLALDDWLPTTTRLVVLAPHPDDEVLACGGLLAMHAARGGASLVIAATDGEGSHPGVAPWTPITLAAARRAESERGLGDIAPGGAEGAGLRVHRLGLADGGVAAASVELARRLAALLRPSDLLLTTWRFDGHPDHEACGHVAASVSVAVGCRLAEAPVWMWHWARPAALALPWQRLRALPLSAEARHRKARALAAHATQLSPRPGSDDGREPGGPVLDAGVLARAQRPTEYFFV